MTQTTTDPRDLSVPDQKPATSGASEPVAAPDPAPETDPRSDAPQAAEPVMRDGGRTPLFDERASGDLRTRWTDVQSNSVDEPRSAVEQADALVGDVMDRLADTFARERQTLESQWSRGEDVTTEDLPLAFQRYCARAYHAQIGAKASGPDSKT